MDDHALRQAAVLLRGAARPLFITGAGLSADSGLPTYRGIGGLYEGRATDDGVPIEAALSGDMLRRNPTLTWKYLWEIWQACAGAQPNAGHRALAEFERRRPGTTVVTQNVDGLHAAAGTRNLVEVHGNAHALRCLRCAAPYRAAELLAALDGQAELPPRCSQCAGAVRPEVVLFGERLADATLAAFARIEAEPPDAVVAVGTTGMFSYIVEPLETAALLEIPTIEINPGDTDLSCFCRVRIRGRAAEALPAILAAL